LCRKALADFENLPHFYHTNTANNAKLPQITGNRLPEHGKEKSIKPLWLKGFIWWTLTDLNRWPLHVNDADEVSDIALVALCWAVEKETLTEYGNGWLEPTGLAALAEVTAMHIQYIKDA